MQEDTNQSVTIASFCVYSVPQPSATGNPFGATNFAASWASDSEKNSVEGHKCIRLAI
jgi:hypothetical protein